MNLDRTVLAAILILFTLSGRAEEVAVKPVYVHADESSRIALMPTPCVNGPILMAIATSPIRDRFQAIKSIFSYSNTQTGEITWKELEGCWAEVTKEEIGFDGFALIFEDGDYGVVRKDEFLGKPQGTGV